MNTQMPKNGMKLALYGALLTGMAFSALSLTPRPAYATSCDCESSYGYAEFICASRNASVFTFECPWTHDPDWFLFSCTDYWFELLPCP